MRIDQFNEGAQDDLAALQIARHASSVFSKWLIGRNEETPLKDALRSMSYPNIGQVYGIPASSVGLPYDDLMLCLTHNLPAETHGKLASYQYEGTDIRYYALVLNAGQTDPGPHTDVAFSIRWSTFVHEFIHYLDHKRGYTDAALKGHEKRASRIRQGKKPLPPRSRKDSLSTYYNDPLEFNAHYQQGMDAVVNILQHAVSRDKDTPFFENFESFRRAALIHMPKSFHLALSSGNVKKLNKRLYKAYEFMAANWPNVVAPPSED